MTECRAQVLCIGVAGTMLLNLLHVAAVAMIASTIGFWTFAQRWILQPTASELA